jgi:hypothetical protein
MTDKRKTAKGVPALSPELPNERRTGSLDHTPNESLDGVLEAYAIDDQEPSLAALRLWIARYPQYADELTDFTARWSMLKWIPGRTSDPFSDAADIHYVAAESQVVDTNIDGADDPTLLLRGMSAVHNALYQARLRRNAEQPAPAVRHAAEKGVESSLAERAREALTRSPDRATVDSPEPEKHLSIDASTLPRAGSVVPLSPGDVLSAVTPVDACILPGIGSIFGEAKLRGLTVPSLANRLDLSVGCLGKLNRRRIDTESIPNQILRRLATCLNRPLGDVTAYLRQPPMFAPYAHHHASDSPALVVHLQDFADAVRSDPELASEQRDRLLALTIPKQ